LKKASDHDNFEVQFEYAIVLYRYGKDQSKVLRYLKAAADGGHSNAQCLYAHLCSDARYLEMAAPRVTQSAMLSLAFRLQKDQPEQAVSLFKQAADLGGPLAQFHYAICLQEGAVCAADLRAANRYYAIAADQGGPRAQSHLAQNLQRGDGIDPDIALANRYYKMAADGGCVHAQSNYAYNLVNGIGVAADAVQGARYYKQAADQGNAAAQFGSAKSNEKVD
jgi:TPR repeat protein